MAEKTLKSRVLMKNDTAENWAKGTNFAPKKGEIIVYNDNPPKIKVGDGETNVNDLPFITYPFTQEQSDKLATIEEGANKTIVDGALSSSSTNSVQNKAIYEELTGNQYTNYLTDGIGAKANYIGVFGLGAASGYIFQAIAPTGFGASQIKVYYEGTLVYTGTAKISTRASGIQFYTFTFTCDNSSKTLTNINSYGFDIQFFDGNGSSVAVSDLENYAFYIRLTDANDETLIAPDWWEMGYTLPTAGSTLGGVKTTSTVSSTTGLTATPIIDGVPYYKDTTYTAGSGIRIVNGNILNSGILSLTNTLSTLKNGEIGYITLTQAHFPASSRLKVKGLDTAAYHSEDYFVPATRTVNGKAFSSDITLSASDVGAASTTHNHDDKYLSLDGGTLKGSLILEHTSPSLIFNDAFGNQWCDLSPNGDAVFLEVYSNNGMSSVGYEFREDGTFWCNALEMDTALSVSNGGTGAGTAAGARTSLGITPANIGAAASSHTHSYLPLSGGALTGNLIISGTSVSAQVRSDSQPVVSLLNSSAKYRSQFLNASTDGTVGDTVIRTWVSDSSYKTYLFGTDGWFYSDTGIQAGAGAIKNNSYPGFVLKNASNNNLAQFVIPTSDGSYNGLAVNVFSDASTHVEYKFNSDGTFVAPAGITTTGNYISIKNNSYPQLTFSNANGTDIGKVFVATTDGSYASTKIRAYSSASSYYDFQFVGNGTFNCVTLVPTNALGIAYGGTGATTARGALANLGIVYSSSQPSSATTGMIWLKPVS